jgi:hypothetical protein
MLDARLFHGEAARKLSAEKANKLPAIRATVLRCDDLGSDDLGI